MRAWLVVIALLLLPTAPLAAQPQEITRPGTVAHPGAHAGFPEQVGEFRRSQVVRYAENNISANYNLRRGDDFLRLSVYIYPAPPVPREQRAAVCRDEMASIDSQIRQVYQDVERLENGEAAPLAGTEAGLRLHSRHRLSLALRSPQAEEVNRDTRLYCYVGGDWLVKFYASSNSAFDADEAIDSFIRIGPWPNRGPASIAMR
jgi:hypothetical protein